MALLAGSEMWKPPCHFSVIRDVRPPLPGGKRGNIIIENWSKLRQIASNFSKPSRRRRRLLCWVEKGQHSSYDPTAAGGGSVEKTCYVIWKIFPIASHRIVVQISLKQ